MKHIAGCWRLEIGDVVHDLRDYGSCLSFELEPRLLLCSS